MTPDPTHPRAWAAVRELSDALEAAAYRYGAASNADTHPETAFAEAAEVVRAYRHALLRALADLEYEVRATAPRPAVPAPSYARRTVEPARCAHTLVGDANSDYLSCPDCGLAVADMAPRQMSLPVPAGAPARAASRGGVWSGAACSHPVEHVARAATRLGLWYCHQCGTCCTLDELIG